MILKLCPLCGGKPTSGQHCKNGFTIKCEKCGFGLAQKVIHLSIEWLEKEMSRRWNTRVDNDGLQKDGFINHE